MQEYEECRIQIKCCDCKQRLMDYTAVGDDREVVMQRISTKCERCGKTVLVQRYTEGFLKANASRGEFYA